MIKIGTNYYHHVNECDHCGRLDIRHICKSMTSFQGYRPNPDIPDDPMPVLVSWQHWKAALLAGGQVWDEYGGLWSTEQFITDVERVEPVYRRQQYDWMRDHYADAGGAWIDGDGFSFSAGEFF